MEILDNIQFGRPKHKHDNVKMDFEHIWCYDED